MNRPVTSNTKPVPRYPTPDSTLDRCRRGHTVGRWMTKKTSIAVTSSSPRPVCVNTMAWKKRGRDVSSDAKNVQSIASPNRLSRR